MEDEDEKREEEDDAADHLPACVAKSSHQDQWRLSSQLDTRTVCCPHFFLPPPPLSCYFRLITSALRSVSLWAHSGLLVSLSSVQHLLWALSAPAASGLRLGFRSSTHPPCGLWWIAAGWSSDRPAGTPWTGPPDPRLCRPLTDYRWVCSNPTGVLGLLFFYYYYFKERHYRWRFLRIYLFFITPYIIHLQNIAFPKSMMKVDLF